MRALRKAMARRKPLFFALSSGVAVTALSYLYREMTRCEDESCREDIKEVKEIDEEMFELFYYEGFVGRSEALRMMFLYADVPYKIVPFATYSEEWPVFACPVLKHAGLAVSQTTAIAQYLGHVLDLDLQTLGERTRVLQCGMDVADMLSEGLKARNGPDKGETFVEGGRLEKWLHHFEKVISRDVSGPYLFGETITYADFLLLNVLRILEDTLGTAAIFRDSTSILLEWQHAIESLPSILGYYGMDTPRLLPELNH